MKRDSIFVVGAIAAPIVSSFTPNVAVAWILRAVGAICVLGFYLLRREARGRREELAIDIEPADWSVKEEAGIATDAWLTIPEVRHKRGKDIGVRISRREAREFELAEPEIQDGSITIRYAWNNFPSNPRIRLTVHIWGRG